MKKLPALALLATLLAGSAGSVFAANGGSPKRWDGLKVTPQDEIEVEGEIDKEWNKTELDVKAVRKVQ